MTRWKPWVGEASGGPFTTSELEFGVEIFGQPCAQRLDIDRAGAQHARRIAIIEQGQQQMFERGVLVLALVGVLKCTMQRSLEALGECRQRIYSFSMVHCRGWPFCRATSMTCVTLVSATS